MNPISLSDLMIVPPDDMAVPNRIPRNIDSQVVWFVEKIPGILSTAVGTAISQVNYSFSLQNHDQVNSLVSLFDQWTLPMYSISFESLIAPGALTAPPTLYTALDFDNANPLAAPADVNITNYPSCESLVLEPGAKIVRSIRPCLKVVAGTTAATGPTLGSATNRMWVDTLSQGTPFYGIRTVLVNNSNTAVFACEAIVTLYFAFRNCV
jgi:hypothetical protein